jgi:hypothetical protein
MRHDASGCALSALGVALQVWNVARPSFSTIARVSASDAAQPARVSGVGSKRICPRQAAGARRANAPVGGGGPKTP